MTRTGAVTGGSGNCVVENPCRPRCFFSLCCRHRLKAGQIWRGFNTTAVTPWSCRLSHTGDRCDWRAPRLLCSSAQRRITNQVNTMSVLCCKRCGVRSLFTPHCSVLVGGQMVAGQSLFRPTRRLWIMKNRDTRLTVRYWRDVNAQGLVFSEA